MSDVTMAALIGAGAAILGGVVVGAMNIATERFRVNETRKEARRNELLKVMTKFLAAHREWMVPIESMPLKNNEPYFADVWKWAPILREAQAELRLIGPDSVLDWLHDYAVIRDAFHDAAMDYIERGDDTADDPRDPLAEQLHAEMERGTQLCRSALHKESLAGRTSRR